MAKGKKKKKKNKDDSEFHVDLSKISAPLGFEDEGDLDKLWGDDPMSVWDEDYEDQLPEVDVPNPKIQAGSKKVSLSVIPPQVLAELALAMMEGARKYGAYNWRKGGVVASTYYDAAMRHMISYWEGDDYDPEARCLHLVKAIASLTILVDAILQENVEDNRPVPARCENWLQDANSRVEVSCLSTSQKTTGN